MVGQVYGFSPWAITQAIGEGTAVEATATDPTGAVLRTVEKFIGVFGVDAINVLLVTSLFASILSCHNILSRYTFNLANGGILPTRLGDVHKKHKSPFSLGVVVFVLIGADAALLYARLAGIFGYALLLLTATSIAVLVYLNRARPEGLGLWHRVIAPLIALAGLLLIVVLGTVNMDVLLGVTSGEALLMLIGLYVLWILGAIYARVLKVRRPSVYATIGRQRRRPARQIRGMKPQARSTAEVLVIVGQHLSGRFYIYQK